MSPDELTLAHVASGLLDEVDEEIRRRLAAITERVDPVPTGLAGCRVASGWSRDEHAVRRRRPLLVLEPGAPTGQARPAPTGEPGAPGRHSADRALGSMTVRGGRAPEQAAVDTLQRLA